MPPSHERELTSKSSQTETVEVGQIVGSFGLKGQLKIQSSTDFLDRFDKGQQLLINGKWFDIEKSSLHKGRPLVKLKGIGNIEAAETLKWAKVESLGKPNLADDVYLIEDLIGMEVIDQDDKVLGTVKEVLKYPAHDILVVGELMVPLIKEFVKGVDLTARKISVQLIPGMIGDE